MSLEIPYDINDIEYLGIFLTPQSQAKLKQAIPATFKQKSGDHITIVYDPDEEQLAKFEKFIGKKIVLTATHEVVTDRIQAIRIKDVWTERGTPHITISWITGGSPSEANEAVATQRGVSIQPWLKLEGYYDVFPRSFESNPFPRYRRNADSRFRRFQRLYQIGEVTPEKYISEFERIYADRPEPEIGREIQRVYVVSSAHITRQDAVVLDQMVGQLGYNDFNRDWTILPHFDYGWWLHIDDSMFPSRIPLAQQLFSPELVELLKLAYIENCQWLRIDQDGPQYDDLPQFDW